MLIARTFKSSLQSVEEPGLYSGADWVSNINGDTEIDVMAVDHQKKQVFAGECKYHNKPVDATVYYELEEKVKKSAELRTAFPA